MEFINLKAQYSRIKKTVDSSINNVLSHGKYIMGPEVGLLETQLKEYKTKLLKQVETLSYEVRKKTNEVRNMREERLQGLRVVCEHRDARALPLLIPLLQEPCPVV